MATVWSVVDYEPNDFSQVNTVVPGTLIIHDVSPIAALTGSYGQRNVGAGWGRVEMNISQTDYYLAQKVEIDPAISMTAFSVTQLLASFLDDFGTPIFIGYSNENGSSGAPTHWSITDRAGGGTSTTNFSTSIVHYMEAHIITNDGAVSGVEVRIDGVTIYSDFTTDLSGIASIYAYSGIVRSSQGLQNATEYIYLDDFAGDDADWIPEPTDAAIVPDNLILSSIILEQTKATPTIIADNLILSSILLESPIVSAVVSPSDLVLSAIILEQATIGGTITPDDLVLSSIILESPGVSGIIFPDNLVLSSIILEQAIIIPSVIPENLVLSAIILEQTRVIPSIIPDNLILSAIILGETTETTGIYYKVLITDGDLITELSTKADLTTELLLGGDMTTILKTKGDIA